MSRIEQWIAVGVGIIAISGSVGGATLWYVSNEVPKVITKDLDKRAVAAQNNQPDQIVAALATLSEKVEGLTTEQVALKAEIKDNFEFLIAKVLEL